MVYRFVHSSVFKGARVCLPDRAVNPPLEVGVLGHVFFHPQGSFVEAVNKLGALFCLNLHAA